ncbi:phosphoribosylanthranilate isomerase [Bacillus tuaregi]|uniref:phosphoribosylanthranilate isomerase n=1 Tax=Bacillus tuaregi TaxID=1816695 RepID=UPI0008F8E32B|nr:phosphoribosylanthranilate isomerase [Bacillus tuaregi]
MKVKICGLQNIESAQCAVSSGADAIGFVFAESKRRITTTKAKQIISKLPTNVKKVGVFVNPSKEEIERIVSETGIDTVQLHGDESPEFCQSLSFPIIKAFSIETAEDLKHIDAYSCDYILLDGPKGKYYGGNGTTFDWSILSEFDAKGKKVILAGGLNLKNVAAAMKTNVYMLDVSSGVESDGQKDTAKIIRFLNLVKNTQTMEEIK